ncbi:hypothetical protein KEM52_000247 [Ascosphaera acerosa]|nr:hypothetical protein KEM52_000247 [Ascosphaera acerosa]
MTAAMGSSTVAGGVRGSGDVRGIFARYGSERGMKSVTAGTSATAQGAAKGPRGKATKTRRHARRSVKQSSKSRPRRRTPAALVERVSKALRLARKDIVAGTAVTLRSTSESAMQRLDAIQQEHTARLKECESDRGQLDGVHTAPGSQYRNVMDAFVKMHRKESKTLRGLWENWTQVQHQILCLGIEVFGRDLPVHGIELADQAVTVNSSSTAAALAAHVRMEETGEEIQTAASDFTAKVKTIGKESRAQAQELDKKLREERRKQQQEVYHLAEKMLTSF